MIWFMELTTFLKLKKEKKENGGKNDKNEKKEEEGEEWLVGCKRKQKIE